MNLTFEKYNNPTASFFKLKLRVIKILKNLLDAPKIPQVFRDWNRYFLGKQIFI